MSQDNDKFTAGDDLTPGTLLHAAHRAMMANELTGGYGAYRISNAQRGASGPSYGPFQYDLGANDRGRTLFEQIAKTAVDDEGRRFISDRELNEMRGNLYAPFSEIRSTAGAQAAYDRLLPEMNAALNSPIGRELINQDYLDKLKEKVDHVKDVVAAIPHPRNRDFVENSRLAQLIILDTANQYGGAVNSGLHRFMGMQADSRPMPMPGRRQAETIAVNGEFGLEEMIRYKLETQYGQNDGGARDVLRRISNLVDAVGARNITLSDEDKQFLESGLSRHLSANGRDTLMLADPALRGLRELGMGTARISQVQDADAHVLDPTLLHKLREGVRELDQNAGKTWNDDSDRVVASAYGLAVGKGFTGQDDVRLALNQATGKLAAGEILFVYRDGVRASVDPAANRADMTMTDALSMAPNARYAQVESIQRSQADSLSMLRVNDVAQDQQGPKPHVIA